MSMLPRLRPSVWCSASGLELEREVGPPCHPLGAGLRWAEMGVEPKLPALGPKDRGIWGLGYWFRQKKQVLTKSESSMIWNDLENFGFFEVNS